jgi:hypothetical protein
MPVAVLETYAYQHLNRTDAGANCFFIVLRLPYQMNVFCYFRPGSAIAKRNIALRYSKQNTRDGDKTIADRCIQSA